MNFYPMKLRNFRYGLFQRLIHNYLPLKMKKIKVFLSTFTVFVICTFNLQVPAWAADGDLDTSFGTGGKVTTAIGSADDTAYSVVLQSDGKIIAVGQSTNGANTDFAVVRYNADGSLDTSFDTDGKVTTAIGSSNDNARSVVLQSDGKIVVVGNSWSSVYDFAVVRYNADGSLDTSFSGDGIETTQVGGSLSDTAYSVVLQSDGKIIVAGASDSDFAVVRYNADGSLDTSFDTDGKVTTPIGSGTDEAYSVVLQSDGKIILSGYSVGANRDFAVVRYHADGSLDTSFGTGGKVTTPIGSGTDEAKSVVLQSDGKIIAAGYSHNGANADLAVVRYNADGSLDTSFDTDGKVTTPIGSSSDGANSVVLQSDGKIIVAGFSNGATRDFAVVRYNADGSLDTSFDTDGIVTTPIGSGTDEANSVVLQSDGKIIAAGYSHNGANTDFAVVRYSVTIISNNSSSNFNSFPWVGVQSITCPDPNPWIKEQLDFATNAKPVLVSAENTVGKTITQSSYDSLKSSGVIFDTVSKKVSTATETLPIYGCKDKLLSGKVNQPIQFIAGGYTLQSDAHGYINTADLKWHDTNGVTLYTNTAAFLHTVNFTKTGKYVVVLTEQPDTSRGLIPTYGARTIRFVIDIK
jgi:uncharacterized delta-60 repeat protein